MKTIAAVLGCVFLFSTAVTALERKDVEEKYTWNLSDLYKTESDFVKSRNAFDIRIGDILKFKGKLGESSNNLKGCLDTFFSLAKEYSRLSSYASMKADQDLSNSKNQKLKDETAMVGRKFSSEVSFVNPEIISLGAEKIKTYLKENNDLAVYKVFLSDAIRTAKHTLSANEEKLLSQTSVLASIPYNTYSIFSNTELDFPEITLTNGTKVKLSQAMYGKYRSSQNPKDREIVFKNFFDTYKKYEGTLGRLLFSQLEKDWFYAKERKYTSSVEAALNRNNVPVKVYKQLVKDINNNLDSLHRYLALRKRMMGVETLKYSDLYTSLVKEVDLKYTFDDSTKILIHAMQPLGKEYVDALTTGINSRWADVYPTKGKRSGAYSNGSAYDIHPYLLLNHNDDYDSISTLAHEFGHSMHSWFSNKYQPYPTSNYSIFVAEVASTFNENLLNNYLVKKEKDPLKRLFFLGNLLEKIRTTIFRQAMFAEFELTIHTAVEENKALTGKDFSKIYLELVRKYYGHDKGICRVDKIYGIEWAFIPHFYYNYYVYQYATGLIASTALAENVINHEDGAVERYLTFLKSGNSDYPINILAHAGEDLTTSVPLDTTMRVFNRTMDEIEATLKELDK
ncbi:MAG: oligoendopeptidase F [Acidobacteria bacterium]|nr:oligoendopeptidase F [Acidobacteriota bacterium]